jgi:MoaA/NifB/PqqE/SkfB family radical SAM enzyme
LSALRYLPFARRAVLRSGPPIHLGLFVTGVCNLRCRHCFHWKQVAEGVPGPRLVDLERLADSLARMGPLLWVSLGGGEPFLRGDLADVARAFGRHGLRHLTVPTNGLVPERQAEFVERVLSENPELFLTVSVSFDGPPQVHDSIRQVPGGHARAREAVQALRQQAARNPRLSVGILVCVTRENQAVLADHMEELVRELSPDNVTINLARGTALDPSLLEVDVARYEEIVAKKRELIASGALPYFSFPLARLAVARDDLMYERVAGVARGASAHLPCTAGTLSAVVFENGEVHSCEILGRSIGNLNDVGWDLSRLWEGPPARELRREIRETHCACTWECAQADNILFRARSWPRLALRALST